MRPIAEYDNYKVPPPFKGEFTPEVLAAKEASDRRASELKKKLDREILGITDETETHQGGKRKKGVRR